MANYSTLISQITTAISTNGQNLITGASLQAVLLQMVSELGQAGYIFGGVVNPGDSPASSDSNLFYVAATAGTYTNFNDATVNGGELAIFTYSGGSWGKNSVTSAATPVVNDLTTGGATSALSAEMGKQIGDNISQLGQELGVPAKLEFLPNKYIDLSGGVGSAVPAPVDSQSFSYCKHSVTEGDIVIVNGTGGFSPRLWAFADDNDIILSVANASITGVNLQLVTPQNASYVIINTNDTSTASYYKYHNSIASRLEENENRIISLNEDVNDLFTHNRGITPLSITLNLDHFYNGSDLAVGSTFTDSAAEREGIACVSVNVAEGEKYHIKGKGNAFAYKQYWLVDSANKVTRITSEPNIDIEITIQSGEAKLYCNFRNYDSLTEGLWFLKENWLDNKVDAIYQDDIKKDIASPTIVEGYAYNNGSDPIGSIYAASPTQYSGVAYCRVPIIQGIEVTLFGIGSPNAFRYYMFTDKNGAIIEKSSGYINSRASGLKLTIPSNARLLWVNFTSYDSSTDRVEVKYSFGINSLYNDSKPFSGKKIVCFGDSLTEFREAFNRKMRYSDYIAEITGANVINVGIGGTRLSRRATPVAAPTNANEAYAALDMVSLIEAVNDNDYSYATAAATYLDNNGSSGRLDIVQRLSAIEWAKIDAVTILGGTNDWYGGASLGVSDGNDKGTVFGAINEIVRMLLTAYPSIKLYWFTPTVRWLGAAPRTEENWGDNYAVNGKTLREFSSALFGEVVNNHIPTCDMYNTLGWTMYNFQEYFLDSDGTHPYKGFESIGEKMVAFLNANKTF